MRYAQPSSTPWSDAERAQLRRFHENGISQAQMGALLGRTKNSVHRQLSNMGLCRSERNPVKAHTGGRRPTERLHAPKTTLAPLPSLMMEDP